MLVTLHRGLQLVMSKTIYIGDTKYHIQCSYDCIGTSKNFESYGLLLTK